jgi:hypothetical protein
MPTTLRNRCGIGVGLGRFERALERDDPVVVVFGSHIVENQTRVAETSSFQGSRVADQAVAFLAFPWNSFHWLTG